MTATQAGADQRRAERSGAGDAVARAVLDLGRTRGLDHRLRLVSGE